MNDKEVKIKPEEISVLVIEDLEKMLVDTRFFPYGRMVFGTLENLAKQYGIKYKIAENGIIFTSNKSRLQMFVEKLHFANVKYYEI